ncbi:MAG: squalene/phytoene synthase family protein [Phycisphaerales bacterium JB064]
MSGLDPAISPMEMLGRYGPGGGSVGEAEARAYAVGFARRASENFVVLGRVLPAALVEDFAAVYTFCRWADDLGDEVDPSLGERPEPEEVRERALELLAWFRAELESERPTHPVLVALRPTIERHGLGKAEFGKLISAFEMDQRVSRYMTWEELLGYCELSANPVGRIVLMMAGLRPPEEDERNAGAWRKSDAICTALQITNHIQDVRRDLLDRDRVYLPVGEVGFGPDELGRWVGTPEDSEARRRYIRGVRLLVDRTKVLYAEGQDLPALVGGRLGSLIGTMAIGGRATLREIERSGCITLWQRPTVGRMRKGMIAVAGLASLYSGPWRKPHTSSNASKH